MCVSTGVTFDTGHIHQALPRHGADARGHGRGLHYAGPGGAGVPEEGDGPDSSLP